MDEGAAWSERWAGAIGGGARGVRTGNRGARFPAGGVLVVDRISRRTPTACLQSEAGPVERPEGRQQKVSPGKRIGRSRHRQVAGKCAVGDRRSREKGTAPLSDTALRHE